MKTRIYQLRSRFYGLVERCLQTNLSRVVNRQTRVKNVTETRVKNVTETRVKDLRDFTHLMETLEDISREFFWPMLTRLCSVLDLLTIK